MSAAAGQQAGETLPAEAMRPLAGSRRRRPRRRWAVTAVVMIAAAAAVGAAVGDPFTGSPRPSAGPGSGAYPPATAIVIRRTLVSQTQVGAKLGNAGSYSVVNQAQGTITGLPAIGRIVRQGQVLYEVSGSPVVLLYGKIPAYRNLAEGMTGPDVTELNIALARLGYGTRAALGASPGWDYFGPETACALERLQARLGVPVTGSLSLGEVVFLPGPLQVTGLGTTTLLGGPAQPGTAILTASSATPVVAIDLDPAQQTDVKAGDQVTVTLPSGRVTPGSVSSVSTVATTPSPGTPGESASSPTIPVEVSLTDPAAAAGLTQAPVTVTITTGSVSDALVVPVGALLAQPGGYAVEVVSGRAHHLVPVTPGLFDDAAGLVQVTGTELSAGQRVVVPAS